MRYVGVKLFLVSSVILIPVIIFSLNQSTSCDTSTTMYCLPSLTAIVGFAIYVLCVMVSVIVFVAEFIIKNIKIKK